MIRATFNIDSGSPEYKRSLNRNLEAAIRRGSLMVQREAVKLLNTTGKSMPAKRGLNATSTVKQRRTMPRVLGIDRQSQRAMGLYWYGSPLHRWVQASQPGNPPHKQTGTLQRSIVTEYDAKTMQAKIGPSNQLKYARALELGTPTLAPRPYMRPALAITQEKIVALIEKAIAQA